MELSASKYSIHELPGGYFLEELIECNNRLGHNLDEGDWDKAQKIVETRHDLLMQLSGVIQKLDRDSTDERIVSAKDYIRQVLQDINETNDKYVQSLTDSIRSSKDQLLALKKGRNTLELYKRPKNQRPRFLNKVG